MQYQALSSKLRKKKIYFFSLSDIANLFPHENKKTIKNNLTRWVQKDYFLRLKRDLYEFTDALLERRVSDLYIANRLYDPSYVSLEAALSLYSIIPDIAASVTSVTIRPTRTLKNKYGLFLYRACKAEAFTGYSYMLYDGQKVYIADKEKALVDFIYFRLRRGYPLSFKEERLNRTILKKINWKKAFYYAGLFNEKTVESIKTCKEYLKC